jgi:hypothetical protein
LYSRFFFSAAAASARPSSRAVAISSSARGAGAHGRMKIFGDDVGVARDADLPLVLVSPK